MIKFEPQANGKIRISKSLSPVDKIELDKTQFTLNRENNWTDHITILNFKDLTNPKAERDNNSVGIYPNIDENGVITIDTTIPNNPNPAFYQTWNYKEDFRVIVSADNAKNDVLITISQDSISRIGVNCNNYAFGEFKSGSGYIGCGAITTRSLSSFPDAFLFQDLKSGEAELNRIAGFIIPKINGQTPSDGVMWISNANPKAESTTIIVQQLVRTEENTCPAKNC